MSSADLERVRADLATMKEAIVEPAVPSEEIGPGLIVGVFGLALAAAPWIAPLRWVRYGVIVFGIIFMAIFVPWKRKILKRDARRRRMEAKELIIWGIVGVCLVTYMLYYKLRFGSSRGLGEACLFSFGLGCVANGLVHRTRRNWLATGLPMMIAAVLLPFATRPAASVSIVGCCFALGGIASAVTLAWMSRRERSEHAVD